MRWYLERFSELPFSRKSLSLVKLSSVQLYCKHQSKICIMVRRIRGGFSFSMLWFLEFAPINGTSQYYLFCIYWILILFHFSLAEQMRYAGGTEGPAGHAPILNFNPALIWTQFGSFCFHFCIFLFVFAFRFFSKYNKISTQL